MLPLNSASVQARGLPRWHAIRITAMPASATTKKYSQLSKCVHVLQRSVGNRIAAVVHSWAQFWSISALCLPHVIARTFCAVIMASFEERASLQRLAEQQVSLLLHVGGALKQQSASAAQAASAAAEQDQLKEKQAALNPFLKQLTAAVLRKTLAGAASVCIAQAESGEKSATAATTNLSASCSPWQAATALHTKCWEEVHAAYTEFGKKLHSYFEASRNNQKIIGIKRSMASKLQMLQPYARAPTYALAPETPQSVLDAIPQKVLDLFKHQIQEVKYPEGQLFDALQLTHASAVPQPGTASALSPEALYSHATKRRMVEIVEKHRASVAPQWAQYHSEPESLLEAAAAGTLNIPDDMEAVLMAAQQDVQALLPSVAPRKFAQLSSDADAGSTADSGGVLGVGAGSAVGFLPTGAADFRHLETAAGAAFLTSGQRIGSSKRPRSDEAAPPGASLVRLEHVVEWLSDNQRFPGARAALGAGYDRLQQEVDAATAESDVLMTVQRATVKKQRRAMEAVAAKAAAGQSTSMMAAAAAAAAAGSAPAPAAAAAAQPQDDAENDEAEL